MLDMQAFVDSLSRIILDQIAKIGNRGNLVYDKENFCGSVCVSFDDPTNPTERISVGIFLDNSKFKLILLADDTYGKMSDGIYKNCNEDIFVPVALSEKLEKIAIDVLMDPTKHICSGSPYCLSVIAAKRSPFMA